MNALQEAALTILNAQPQILGVESGPLYSGEVEINSAQLTWWSHGLTVLAGLQTRGAIDSAYTKFQEDWLAVWDALQVAEVSE